MLRNGVLRVCVLAAHDHSHGRGDPAARHRFALRNSMDCGGHHHGTGGWSWWSSREYSRDAGFARLDFGAWMGAEPAGCVPSPGCDRPAIDRHGWAYGIHAGVLEFAYGHVSWDFVRGGYCHDYCSGEFAWFFLSLSRC